MIKKIKRLKDLALDLKKLRKSRKKIVHCHGVFDLLHIGHIWYLNEAKSMGEVLVVTLTPDRYVNKGPLRPEFSEDLRAQAIASLESVDFVAINNWETAIETIKLLKPDYYVKGPEYRDYNDDLTRNIALEEKAVNEVGGSIAFTKGHTFSSSKLLNRHFNSLTNEQNVFIERLKSNFSFNDIKKTLESTNQKKVIVIGEAIIDEYVFCDALGKSGKEPMLTQRFKFKKKYLGGSLAVANSLAAFCKEVNLVTDLGDRDSYKDYIQKNLRENISWQQIVKSNSPTIKKTRFIDEYTKNKIVGVYDINDTEIEKHAESKLEELLEKIIKECDLVVVTDFGHGFISSHIVSIIEKSAKFLAVNTQLNSANIGFHTISKYRRCDLVCIHENELRHEFRDRKSTTTELISQLKNLIEAKTIVITQGNQGVLAHAENRFTHCPAFANKVVDRIGAGDILMGITSLCYASDIPSEVGLLFGSLGAGQMVSTMGTGLKLETVNLMKTIKTMMS